MVSTAPKPYRRLTTRADGPRPSATLALNERVHEMWAEGRAVYHLGFGESRFPVHPKLVEALQSNADRHSYLPALGLWELREAVAQFYQLKFAMTVSANQVVIGPGSKALLYGLFMALGQGLILPRPSWVSYAPQAEILGKPVLWIPTWMERGYCLEVDVLRQTLEEHTASRRTQKWAIVLNSPQNPTGTMLPPARVRELADCAHEEQLTVLSDEIYALTAHGSVPHSSIRHHYPEGTVVLGGLSKHLSLGGWRLGVAILPDGKTGEALGHALQEIAGNIWSCVAAPVQHAALLAYRSDPAIDDYVAMCARMHAIRTHYLYQRLAEAGISCAEPSGAFYLFPGFGRWKQPLAAHGVKTSEDLAQHLLARYELATLPGSAFGSPSEELCLRLSSSYLDAGTDESAADLVDAFRADPDPVRFVDNHHPQLREAATRFVEFVAGLRCTGD